MVKGGKSQKRNQEIKEFWGFIARTGKTIESLNKRRDMNSYLVNIILAIV